MTTILKFINNFYSVAKSSLVQLARELNCHHLITFLLGWFTSIEHFCATAERNWMSIVILALSSSAVLNSLFSHATMWKKRLEIFHKSLRTNNPQSEWVTSAFFHHVQRVRVDYTFITLFLQTNKPPNRLADTGHSQLQLSISGCNPRAIDVRTVCNWIVDLCCYSTA